MKIMHVITGLPAGGAENMLFRIATHPSPSDHQVEQIVVSLQDKGALGNSLLEQGVPLYILKISGPYSFFKALITLARLIRKEKPDAIMSWLYHADFVTTLACLLSGNGTRKLAWNMRCAYMDLRQYRWTTRSVVHALALLSPLPAYIAYNSEGGRIAHQKLGYKARKWAYLPNGFDSLKWTPDQERGRLIKKELGLPIDSKLVIMVGRADPAKDYRTYFKAIQILESSNLDAYFLCVGHGTEHLSPAADIHSRVKCLGARKDIPNLMKACDVLVLCSAFGEGFPNVVGEAMLTGVPCIVTDVWDAMPVIQDTGKIVPPQQPDKLSQAIQSLLILPPDTLRTMGAKARQIIQSGYDLESSYSKYYALWEELSRNQKSGDNQPP